MRAAKCPFGRYIPEDPRGKIWLVCAGDNNFWPSFRTVILNTAVVRVLLRTFQRALKKLFKELFKAVAFELYP